MVDDTRSNTEVNTHVGRCDSIKKRAKGEIHLLCTVKKTKTRRETISLLFLFLEFKNHTIAQKPHLSSVTVDLMSFLSFVSLSGVQKPHLSLVTVDLNNNLIVFFSDFCLLLFFLLSGVQ